MHQLAKVKTAPVTLTELEETVEVYFHFFLKYLHDPSLRVAESAYTKLNKYFPMRSKSSNLGSLRQISAVLTKHGLPYINGLDPDIRFTENIEDAVARRILNEVEFDNHFLSFCIHVGEKPTVNYANLLVKPPKERNFQALNVGYGIKRFAKPNYLELEQKIATLKSAGDRVALDFEKWRLNLEGKQHLSEQIKYIAKDSNQASGYDILSKNSNGTNRYIIVRTTKLGIYTPFYFSENERNMSNLMGDNFYTYRVFDVGGECQLYILRGSLDQAQHVHPIQFQASF